MCKHESQQLVKFKKFLRCAFKKKKKKSISWSVTPQYYFLLSSFYIEIW